MDDRTLQLISQLEAECANAVALHTQLTLLAARAEDLVNQLRHHIGTLDQSRFFAMAQLNCTAGVFAAPIERTAELQRDAPIAVPARREVQSQYPAGEVPTPLTPREVQVLKLVAEGYRTKEIAPLLNITLKTVVSHKSHIMEKLNIHDAVGLTRYAIRRGISSAGIVREQVPA